MEQSSKIKHVAKNKSGICRYMVFDSSKIVSAILKAMGKEGYAYGVYKISHISKKLNLKQSDLINILTHARIEIIDDYVPEEGIQYLVDREVGKIKRYFERSLANYALLSVKEQRIFNAFLKRYGIKYKEINSWKDLKIETIRKDCYNDLTQDNTVVFYNGKYIDSEEIETTDYTKSKSIIQLTRSSLMYNIQNMRKWIRFKPISDSTITYILMHHFHIFISDDYNSIHTAKQNTMFHLPQNAKNYILAA